MEHEITLKEVMDRLEGVPGFDIFAINHLTEDTGANTVLRILARFSVSLEESLPGFDQADDVDRQTKIWKSAHKLAGSAEMLGFKEFGMKSKQLSSILKGNPASQEYQGEISAYKSDLTALLDSIANSFPDRQRYL